MGLKLSEAQLRLLGRLSHAPVLWPHAATAGALRRRKLARYNDVGRLAITERGAAALAEAESQAGLRRADGGAH